MRNLSKLTSVYTIGQKYCKILEDSYLHINTHKISCIENKYKHGWDIYKKLDLSVVNVDSINLVSQIGGR